MAFEGEAKRSAAMGIKIAELRHLPPGSALVVYTPDGEEIALFNIEGNIYALNNECPHMGGPLGEGTIDRRGRCVTCPWHGWEFDLTSGECINVEGERAKKISIEVRDDGIYLAD